MIPEHMPLHPITLARVGLSYQTYPTYYLASGRVRPPIGYRVSSHLKLRDWSLSFTNPVTVKGSLTTKARVEIRVPAPDTAASVTMEVGNSNRVYARVPAPPPSLYDNPPGEVARLLIDLVCTHYDNPAWSVTFAGILRNLKRCGI